MKLNHKRFERAKLLLSKLPSFLKTRDVNHFLNLSVDDVYRIASVVSKWKPPETFSRQPLRSKLRFCQQPIDRDSAIRRAKVISALNPKRVLLVGDDDLVSLELDPSIDVSVIDIDDRILDFIKKQKPSINTYSLDITEFPANVLLHGESYDVVMTDPPNNYEDAVKFLDFCMAFRPKHLIYNTMTYLVGTDIIDYVKGKWLLKSCIPNFSFYPFSYVRKWCNKVAVRFFFDEKLDLSGSFSDLYIFSLQNTQDVV